MIMGIGFIGVVAIMAAAISMMPAINDADFCEEAGVLI